RFFHPSRGFTDTRERCQPTLTPPLAGESNTSRSRPEPTPPPPVPPGCSSITSSNWIETSSFHLGTTEPDSGLTWTICGGRLSGGPPGGVPTLAHAPASVLRSSPAT